MSQNLDSFLVFGPVPSRRLGRSLGINNVPAKRCTYSCVYCQIGYAKTIKPIRRKYFFPKNIIEAINKRIKENAKFLDLADVITIVPDGEPTLDKNLGKLILLLKQFNKPIAVLTNGSLLWKKDVKNDLMNADLVSIKIDSLKEKNWRFINQPNEYLNLNKILTGINDFANDFKGELITETMLIKNIDYNFVKIGNFIKKINNLKKSYVTIPTRPPSFNWVKPADEITINTAYQILKEILGDDKVELMLNYEEGDFYFTGDTVKDILCITEVHPIKESILKSLLEKFNCNWNIVEDLLKKDLLKKIHYNKDYFYLRKIKQVD